ncbi:hypothetical protein C4E24_04010 [ANME-1 cluster archaeon AG-394-G21]|nr:hypothetical protein [ANME-1 cluster archaeon AG-394-G21]
MKKLWKVLSCFVVIAILMSTIPAFIPGVNAVLRPYDHMGTVISKDMENNTISNFTIHILKPITKVHNLNTGEDFVTIQAAIDDPETLNGHVISVDPGKYRANVIVNKSLTINSTSGNPADTVVLAADPDANVFSVSADHVNICGFTVQGADELLRTGIHLNSTNNCIIANNNVANNFYGIRLQNSSNNAIYHNEIANNTNQAYDDTGTNAWNSSYPSGGNYWSDYTEKYKAEYKGDPEDNLCGANPDQICDGDGIWDKPYKCIGGDANATDIYPLVSRYCAIPPDKYLFIEKRTQWIIEVLDGDFGLWIDRPTYECNVSVGELYPYSVARVRVNDTLVGIYGNGTSLHVINGTGGGAASGLTGFYSIPFIDSELTIMAIYADGSAKIMFGTETRVLVPGDEWQGTRGPVKRYEETGALINESFVTVIKNFGLWAKSKIAQHAVIGDIVSDPEFYEGQKVIIDGEYRGWNCSGVSGPGITRSDWCVRDGTGIIYVTGLSSGLDYPDDMGERVIVTGVVKITERDIVYIEAANVEI